MQSAVPVRVRRATGWVPIDRTLRLTADGVTPVATSLDLRFSPGGTGELLSFGRDGKRVSLTWSQPLPTPVIAGATATYPEVLAGVDLRLTANADSFSEVLVVKTAAAAKNAALSQLQFDVAGHGVTLRQNADDVIQAVDSQGAVVFVSDGAAMWDSSTAATATSSRSAPKTRAAGEGDPGEPGELVKIPVTLSDQSMTVTPSQQMLTSADARFPLYIDPGFNGGKEVWTVVSRLHPDTSYWTNDSYRDTMRVGQSWHSSSSDDWRTIVQFNIGALSGSQILSASVLTKVAHTADCTRSPLGLFLTKPISTSKVVTWNNTKTTDATKKWWSLRTVNATANKSSCPKGDDEVEFGDPSGTSKIRSAFQSAATAGSAAITFGFRAPDEADDYQWKKLTKDSTYLDINYNRKPGVPTALSVSPCDRNPCASPAKTNSEKPKLSMTATDPDGGALTYEFEVWNSTMHALKAKSGTAVTGVKSGRSAPWTVLGLDKKRLPDANYLWRGRACDGSKFCSAYSAWYKLTIDTTNPGAPTVDITPYKRWTGSEDDDVPGGYGSPGTPGSMTIKPSASTDVVSYYNWWFTTGDTKVHKLVPAADGTATTPIVPAREGPHTIRAYAVDAAGNRTQGEAEYSFKVAPAGGQWVWHMDDNQPGLTGSLPQNNRPLRAAGTGQSWTDRNDGFALALNGSGALTTDLPVLNTTADSGFTVAAWVRLAEDSTTEPPPDDGTTPVPDPGDDTGEEDPAEPDAPAGEKPPSVLDNSMTAVSQAGVNTSMFRLGYRRDVDMNSDGTPDGAWCFTLDATDSVGAATTQACSAAYLQQGDWVHLVGVADRIHNEIRLYINGGPGLQFGDTPDETGVMANATGSAAWAASQAFAVGRGQAADGAEYWHGELDDVYAVPRVWSDAEIETYAARENW
ncbi:LamG-like jellyroll fold domain-containing protein [Actinoplanes sp. NPDC048791]|uniref:LamG-like jellyroll fold domain-containing protein n=1 Tax=Actinoplanes sp. NPDC048791 TaxID=3154623 RepID=UPI0034102656